MRNNSGAISLCWIFFISAVCGKLFLVDTESETDEPSPATPKPKPKPKPKKTGYSADEENSEDPEGSLAETRILGGVNVKDIDDMPWQVSIKIADKGREILCGGTMVQPNNVVTAASCLLQKGKVSNRTNIQVFTHSLKAWKGRKLKVVSVLTHPDYDPEGLNDVAVLKISEGDSDVDIAACLPTRPISERYNTKASIAGYGLTSNDGYARIDMKLNVVNLTIREECTSGERQPGTFCAGGEKGKDACSGDSGGPVFVYEDECQTAVLIGIMSTGGGVCGQKGVTGTYTDVYYLLKQKKRNKWLCRTLGWRSC